MKKSVVNLLITVIFLFNIIYLYVVQRFFCPNIPFIFTTVLCVFELYLLYKDISRLERNQEIMKNKLEGFSKSKNKFELNSDVNESSMNTLLPWILILCFFMTKVIASYNSLSFWIAFGVQLLIGIPVFFVYSFARLIPNDSSNVNKK